LGLDYFLKNNFPFLLQQEGQHPLTGQRAANFILLSNSAHCTVLHAVVLTQNRRVTDGQTDRRTELL